MGGAADLPQRSSSPLKRPASDLETDIPSSQKDDVDMIPVPSSEPTRQTEDSAEQPEPRAASVDMTQDEGNDDEVAKSEMIEANENAAPAKSAETEIPPIDVQIKTVTTIYEAAGERQPNEGDEVYLVSRRWLGRVISRGSDSRKNSKVEPDGEIGPVDNSDIVQQIITDAEEKQFVQLKPGMADNFVLFPQEAWDLVMEWYGIMPGTLPIVRVAHNTNPDKNGIPNVQYEFNPPVFKIHRLYSDNGIIMVSQVMKATNPAAPLFVFSQSTKYVDFLSKIKRKAGIVPLNRKVRIWRVPRLQPAAEPLATPANAATPPASRPSSPNPGDLIGPVQRAPQDSWTQMLLDVPSFTQLKRNTERELVDFKDHSANSSYNGNMDLSMAGLGEDQTIVIDELVQGENNFISNFIAKGSKTTAASSSRNLATPSQTNSGRTSPAPTGPMTRGRTQKAGKPQGAVGLGNMGNTCYMNSALQCLRSVEELTKYFLVGAAEKEINEDNPLGNHGDVARAYGHLLHEIYRENPPSTVTPRSFKNTVGKYAPSFSGYGQQDSQEFLGFLLDGLQEDLSRVKKKPYIEKPDSTDEMVNDPQAIREMAAKVWDITKQRDDSVVADLFTGMYKSTLVCPVCSKVSITFDPFNNLTLQLPIENSWSHQVFYFPLNDRPVRLSVDIDKNASIAAMKEFISSRVNVPTERLFSAEQFKSKFYKIHDDTKVASEEISTNDEIMIYELEAKPTNWPAPKKPKKPKKSFSLSYNNTDSAEEDDVPGWEDPMAEMMLVPVFHRRPNNAERNTRGYSRKPWAIEPVPHFIMLSRDEAKSEEMIKRKILEKIATFSTHPDFEEEYDADRSVADSADADIVLTTGSDADSSGGSKVVANSIDGEDELVDVVMKDSSPKTATARFNTRRPKFVAPNSFLTPSLQNMFDVGFFSGAKEMIPTGWNVVDEDKTFPNINTRAPQQPISNDHETGSENLSTNSRTQSESSEEDAYSANGVISTTRMAEEESSDEDAVPPAVKVLPVRPAGPKSGVRVGYNKRRAKGIKTYSKKGMQSARKLRDSSSTASETSDQGPLVRLGEGLVVDWKSDAWAAMYGKDGPDDNMRGDNTWVNMPDFEDPELAAKRAARQLRRKNGITLDDCLDEFGKEEILSEADTWYCPRCKEHQRASKKFELWKTPDILVMHLKRFSNNNYRRDKLDVFVDFPIEGLDLSSRVIETEEGKQEVYDLFAVDDHWGGLGGGHYTAFAKNFYDNEWWEYNDTSAVKQRDSSRVVTSSAYLLFYRRRSDVPLGGPRFQQITRDFENPGERSEDDASESGEGQGLVGNSSLRGSPSALTGVGAARHQPNRGSPDGEGTMTINPSALEKLPAYETHEELLEYEDDDADLKPLLYGDHAPPPSTLRPSIEDEGIDMSMGYNDLNFSNKQGILTQQGDWTFASLNDIGSNSRGEHMVSGTGSDIASDDVQHDSSASETSLRERYAEFGNTIAEDDGAPFVDQSPVPDLDEMGQASAIALQADLLDNMNRGVYPGQEFEVTAEDERFEVEEPAVEIHVKDNEDLKMD
ncbi:UCH-domain-containing protein [Mollisia scopiformis]|uniref:ubiquitinyl hydrolase 1 n=1 Tax=Mollisia scopiformis TaxID=149040 RepID=A0A194XGF1_MOLSC|nr:UCH-domain-containing protein [Mollisia scopiformis]KUJ19216.1 UCH-domain-containing protein [Mollisia scopiformis]